MSIFHFFFLLFLFIFWPLCWPTFYFSFYLLIFVFSFDIYTNNSQSVLSTHTCTPSQIWIPRNPLVTSSWYPIVNTQNTPKEIYYHFLICMWSLLPFTLVSSLAGITFLPPSSPGCATLHPALLQCAILLVIFDVQWCLYYISVMGDIVYLTGCTEQDRSYLGGGSIY